MSSISTFGVVLWFKYRCGILDGDDFGVHILTPYNSEDTRNLFINEESMNGFQFELGVSEEGLTKNSTKNNLPNSINLS